MDLDKIEKLIALMKNYDLGELRVSGNDWEFSARRGDSMPRQQYMVPQPIQSGVALPVVQEAAPAAPASNTKEIPSPIVGTFYRAPAPDQAPYKEVGDMVSPDDVVCIVEAMKVMNEIKAGVSGKIKKILLENGSSVEYGQGLFLVEAG